MLDCSAIAKGFGVDAVARLLERKGIKNYMVDIGGEVVVRGKNSKMNAWRIGINKPVDDSLSVNQELQTVLAISDVGMATSGNYRNFYYKGGKKYAHTIDPRTGYPVQHSILSSTVIAKDCASADAYATAFMVMGLDSAKAFCEAHPELDAYFICSGEGDKYERIEVKEFIPTKANDIPMAKASMLVAIASVTTTFNLVGSKQRLSSLLKLSFIIRPPKKANNPKAIQWS